MTVSLDIDAVIVNNGNTSTISTSGVFELIVAATFGTTGSSVASFSDTAGLTWNHLGSWSSYGDVEIWWAIANAQLTNDTITPVFSGSPANSWLAVAAYQGVDLSSPFIGGISAYVTAQLATYDLSNLEWVLQYLEFLVSDLGTGGALNVSGGVTGSFSATETPDHWSGTSFLQITGVAGGDGTGTGVGTVTTPGIMGEAVGDASTGVSPGYPLPFTFAWVDASENVFTYDLARVDEEILSIDLKHEEGQVPTLEIEIKNPRIGLLNPSRKQWAWLAYQPPPTSPGPAPFLDPGDYSTLPNGYGSPNAVDLTPPAVEGTPEYVAAGYVQPGYQVYDGAMNPLTPPNPAPPPPLEPSTPTPPPVPSQYIPGASIIPLFFGELLGVPSDLFAERVTLKFLARPMDYIEQKQAVAETLKIPGNYEPIFLDEKNRDQPDSILEGWSKLYHVDRTTLLVSASDVLVGEDGTTVFPESPAEQSAIYKSVKVKIGQAPLTNVQVQANVHWIQRSIGYVNGPHVTVGTYHGGTFLSDWQALHGKSIGAGWTVEAAYADDAYMVEHTPTWHISSTTTFYGSLADYDCACSNISESMSAPALLGTALHGQVITTFQVGICNPGGNPLGSMVIAELGGEPAVNIPAKLDVQMVYVPLWGINCTWNLRYNAKREFTEMAIITVSANTQAVLTSPTVEQDTLLIKMTGEVGEPVLVYDAWSDFAGKYVPFGTLIFPNDPITAGGLSYQICTTLGGGVAGLNEPIFSDVPGTTTQDGGVTWASLGEQPQSKIQRMAFNTTYDCGTILVVVEQYFDVHSATLVDTENSSYFIVTDPNGWKANGDYALVTFVVPPTSNDILLPQDETVTFEPVSSVLYSNGNVVAGIPWYDSFSNNQDTARIVNIGNPSWLGIPVGGTAEDVVARFFFPSARGEESLVYGINRARAKIRMRARAVDVSWECPFDMVVGMSCRQNATIFDPRLPGGVATGKVTSYGMTASKGKMRGHVTIGCSVGYNAFGNPGADISYSGAVFEPFDDGLAFPLSDLPCDGGVFSPDPPIDIQDALVELAITNPPEPSTPAESGTGGVITTTTGVGPVAAWAAGLAGARFSESLNPNTVGWSMEIQPVTNGPFSGSYAIAVTPLELPMGIDLAAPSQE